VYNWSGVIMIAVGMFGIGFGLVNTIWANSSECKDTAVGKIALTNNIVHWIILGITYGIVLAIYIVGLV